jgi:hypothetical protein
MAQAPRRAGPGQTQFRVAGDQVLVVGESEAGSACR